MNNKEKKCGESCGCNATQEGKKEIKQDDKISDAEVSKEKIEQDPTRFGDWQVNGRAIDF